MKNSGDANEPSLTIPDHELIRRIGRGSYGEVWLARNVMGSYRAVKIVHRQSFEHDRPFEREFEGLQHFEPISRSDNCQVPILHVGRGPDYFYYVMELADDQIRGQQIEPDTYAPKTLSSEMSKHQRLPFRDCVDIGVGLTAALAHLHKNGLVHRDVKPANVIFVNGIPKLADIGLVTDTAATMSFVGTEGFVPPEGPGTPAADIYSLGKVLYEISSGKDRLAFPEPPTLLGEFVDREDYLELSAIVARACEPETRKRYASAEAMQADLLLLKAGKSIRRTHKLERQLKLMRRVAAGIVALIVLGAFPYFIAIHEAKIAKVAAQEQAELRQKAEANEKLAQTEAAKSQQTAQFLEDMLNAVGPSVAAGRDTRLLRDILDTTAARVTNDLASQPEVQAELCNTLGEVYVAVNEFQKAEAMNRRALELRKKLFAPDDGRVAQSLLDLGEALVIQTWWNMDRETGSRIDGARSPGHPEEAGGQLQHEPGSFCKSSGRRALPCESATGRGHRAGAGGRCHRNNQPGHVQ
jgi:serine/threonine protein kinase